MATFASILLLIGLLVDLVQIPDAFWGLYDFRLWQLILGILVAMTLLSGRLHISKVDIYIVCILTAHTFLIFLVSDSPFVSILVQLCALLVLFFCLRAAIRTMIGARVLDVYLLAAVVLAVSMFGEFTLAAVLPEFADNTIYQALERHPGPYGFVRAHGLMMEPSQASLILPPATFLALMSRRYLLVWMFILAIVISFSALTYMGLAAALTVYVYLTQKVRALWIAGVGIAILPLAYLVDPVWERIVLAMRLPEYVVMTAADARTIQQDLMGSLGSLVLAVRVAIVDFGSNFYLGAGLGNFSAGAEHVVGGFSSSAVRDLSESTALFTKVNSGGGLLIRILGEFGVLGALAIIFFVLRVAASLSDARNLVISDLRFRADWRVQMIGLFAIVFFPYLVRKDIYLSIYLLVPFAAWTLAVMGIRPAARKGRRRPVISKPQAGQGFAPLRG